MYYQALSIELRDPKIGDTHTLVSNAIVRENRNGDVLSIDDWPKNIILKFDFDAINRTKKLALENFLIQSAGQEIQVDFNGTWLGVIITPIIDIITIRDECDYEVGFEFQGRKIA